MSTAAGTGLERLHEPPSHAGWLSDFPAMERSVGRLVVRCRPNPMPDADGPDAGCVQIAAQRIGDFLLDAHAGPDFGVASVSLRSLDGRPLRRDWRWTVGPQGEPDTEEALHRALAWFVRSCANRPDLPISAHQRIELALWAHDQDAIPPARRLSFPFLRAGWRKR